MIRLALSVLLLAAFFFRYVHRAAARAGSQCRQDARGGERVPGDARCLAARESQPALQHVYAGRVVQSPKRDHNAERRHGA